MAARAIALAVLGSLGGQRGGVYVAASPRAIDEPGIDYSFAKRGDVNAVAALLRRTLRIGESGVLPFRLEMVDKCVEGARPPSSASNLCFEVLDDPKVHGIIVVRGTSAVDIARGAAHYLRSLCNMSFAWAKAGGNQVRLPSSWPPVGAVPIVRWRLRDISYGFNVCTFSYSHVWYKFNGTDPAEETWENIIDWMALSGINLALAYTGQEEVYRKVYEHFGVDAATFGAWSNGPAHLTWSRGQSMHGIGGPLPQSWTKEQWHLQRSILGRMRSLGITPILPAFQGNVPPKLKVLHPAANITVQTSHWGNGSVAWLDATDPLFQAIGDKFMTQLIADFGIDTNGDGVGDVTEHWYEADGLFAAGNPPWRSRRLQSDSTVAASAAARASRGLDSPSPQRLPLGVTGSAYATKSSSHSAADSISESSVRSDYNVDAYAHSLNAYRAMNATDPDAIWMYQGWILDDSDHSLSVMKAYAAAVPRGRLLVSDMWAEWRPISPMLAKAGVPYLYGVLQNFGGTLYLGMSVKALNDGSPEDPRAVPSIFDTFSHNAGGVGVGAFPEGIDQNPAYYTYFFDAAWMAAPELDLPGWWARYALERYGCASEAAARAWTSLGGSVYGVDERKAATEGGFWREKAKGGLLSAPLLGDESDDPSHNWYNVSEVFSAWEMLVAAAASMRLECGSGASSATLRYDVVNVGREILDRVANVYAKELADATGAEAAAAAGRKLLAVLADADALLCTDASLSMSSWVGAARAMATGDKAGEGTASTGERVGDAGDALADFYDRMARAQVTTWLPACANASEAEHAECSIHLHGAKPALMDYANKAWGGLVEQYYAGRVRCYLQQWQAAPPAASSVDVAAYYACVDGLARDFQGDFGSTKFPMCSAPQGDALAIAAALVEKYRSEVSPLSAAYRARPGGLLVI